MGRPKLLLELGGRPVVRHVVEALLHSAVDEVIVVLGPNAPAMRAALSDLPVRLIDNPDHETGMASSMRAGLSACGPEVEAALIALGDQPFQRPELFDRLVAAYRDSGQAIVVPLYAGQRGNPVVFDRSLFPELLEQQGDQGGRAVLAAHTEAIQSVPIESADQQRDLDTWRDYETARAALGSG
jgi:molybdenum cofactor cytidylyltransferase